MFTNKRNKTQKRKQTGHRVEAWGGTAAKGTSVAEQGEDEGKWFRARLRALNHTGWMKHTVSAERRASGTTAGGCA